MWAVLGKPRDMVEMADIIAEMLGATAEPIARAAG